MAGGSVVRGLGGAVARARRYLRGCREITVPRPGRIDATTAVNLLSYNRYFNVVGNVLGTPGYTTTYEAHGGPGQSQTVFNLGGGNSNGDVTVPDDPMVVTTLMRWG